VIQGFKTVIMGLINAVFFGEEKYKGQNVGVLYFLSVHVALSFFFLKPFAL
jgi:hypothetical protein